MRRLWSESPVVAGRWTLREVVQGKPLRHPSHPLFVHFPAALPLAAFAFDIASRVHADLTLPRAAFYNLAFALGMTLPAAVTGLVDYLPMVPGSRKRRLGTYHLLCQLSAAALFAASLAIRLLDYDARQTAPAAVALLGLGCLSVAIGNYFGGTLVYRQGMRVSVDL
ncbi:MAG: DUF2231 domain-containing protein [Dehalococcoidia bacterium]|jgi:uncharacterized membrane protein|nr:DUF2231 domain-containing protein [Dehalococcoidia bacterium]MDW8009270.1 DUF2231 domain-containing protein [Chloroflexota bacterium]